MVFRTFGYGGGEIWDPTTSMDPLDGAVYERDEMCAGHELHIDHCNHDGFIPAYSDLCRHHEHEAGVRCTRHGRLVQTHGQQAALLPRLAAVRLSFRRQPYFKNQ